MVGPIHVIEPDVNRRAGISRKFMDLNINAEFYRDITSFGRVSPRDGCVFASDNAEIVVAMTKNSRLPFVMYSENPSTEDVVNAMRAGALGYLPWPFEPSLLHSTIRHLELAEERLLHEHQFRVRAAASVDRLTSREKEV